MSPRLTSISSSSVERDRHRRERLGQLALVGDDRLDAAALVRRQHHDLVALRGRTPEATVPQKPRKSRFGRLTYCTGKRRSIRLRSEAMCTVSSWCSSVSPWYHGMCVLGSTTLSPFSADSGMKRRSPMSSRVAKSMYSRLDPLEDLLRPADEVHLVDGDDDVPDAEQRDDEAVAPRLLQDAVAGVDQDDRQVAVRRAGRHVARVLLVARAVGDDELAARWSRSSGRRRRS